MTKIWPLFKAELTPRNFSISKIAPPPPTCLCPGKNDGSVGGKHYFRCNPGYGVLVRPNRVSRGATKRRRLQQQQQQKRRSANLSGSSPNLAALTALAKGDGGGAAGGGGASTNRSRGENRKSWNT